MNGKSHILDHVLYGLLGLILISIVLVMATNLAAKKPVDPGVFCPEPTVEQNGICVLTEDRTLNKALRLSSGMTLDCKGHRLVPTKAGKEASQTKPSTPSVPVAGIFLNDVSGVTVQNCVIDGFDFGVVITNGKGKNGNNIQDNTISSLNHGVTIIQSDNNLVGGNTIQFRSRGSGAGVFVWQDSDFNHVEKNTITSPSTSSVFPSPGYPGGKDIALGGGFSGEELADPDGPRSVTGLTGGSGIALFSFHQIPDFKIEETALQFVRDPKNRAESNLLEENNITIKGNPNEKTYSAPIDIGSYQKGTIIRKNILMEGDYGMRLAPVEDIVFGLPFTEEDYSRNILIEDNHVEGKFSTGIINLRNVINSTVRGNFIRTTGGNSETGIVVAGPALESTTVTRNHIDSIKTGIRLSRRNFEGQIAQFYGAKIFLNDFTNSEQAISLGSNYNFTTELSVDDKGNICGPGSTNCQGNYWERTCADSEGFREFGQPNPDSPSSLAIDSHPYGVPVANMPDNQLPAPCQ
jgi:nitrous oxidase accessory protein NosD